jgi:hypothetical protein
MPSLDTTISLYFKGADWGIEGAFVQVDDGGVHDGPPQTTSEDGDFDIDERKPVKVCFLFLQTFMLVDRIEAY